MSKMFTEKGVSLHTQAEMTECMDGKTEEEKERLAEQLLEIISTSSTEEEMIAKSIILNCRVDLQSPAKSKVQ